MTDEELEDFHGLPLSMQNGHSIDGASPGSDLNEGRLQTLLLSVIVTPRTNNRFLTVSAVSIDF